MAYSFNFRYDNDSCAENPPCSIVEGASLLFLFDKDHQISVQLQQLILIHGYRGEFFDARSACNGSLSTPR